MDHKTIIELNGNRYDAKTGALLKASTLPATKSGRTIDGFFRKRANSSNTTTTPKKASESTAIAAAPAPKRRPRLHAPRRINHAKAHIVQPAVTTDTRVRPERPQHATTNAVLPRSIAQLNHAKPHTVQSSETLMRKAVKRPSPSLAKQLHPQGALQHSVPSLIATKVSAQSVHEARLARAKTTKRSPKITHIASVDHKPGVSPNFLPLAVQPVPVKPEAEEQDAPAPHSNPTTQPNIFEQAIAGANHYVDLATHRAHFKKQSKRHMASMASGALALLLLAGFATYQNTPGLQLKIAGIRAGTHTSLPSIQAAGFAYTGVQIGNAKLIIGLRAGGGHYELTQTATNLSSEDMIASVGSTDASGAPRYQTVRSNNTTIYRFSNNSATWVQNGTWYTLSGDHALSDTQVVSLAKRV